VKGVVWNAGKGRSASGLLVLTTALAAPVSVAQSPLSSPEPRTPNDLVTLVVSVADDKGRPVLDLGPDDFTVKEDGRPRQVRAFARAGDPRDDPRLRVSLALLLDVSESMSELTRPARAAAAAVEFLGAVPRAQDLLVFPFAREVRGFSYRAAGRDAALRLIAAMPVGGNTALYDAVQAALSSLANSAGRHVVVLVSDGEDTVSRLSRGDANRAVEASGVTLYAIAPQIFPRGEHDLALVSFLRNLAEGTGGRLLFCADAQALPDIYAQIRSELSSQYVLGFVPAEGRAGKRRKLDVELRRPGCRARYRRRYDAPANSPRSGQP
jgi:Ca-activated chloride channel homolog